VPVSPFAITCWDSSSRRMRMHLLFDVKGKAISLGVSVELARREDVPPAKLLAFPKIIQALGIESHAEEERDCAPT
jgi:hypothetical protein